MNLDQYLTRPDAESMAALARSLNLNPDQVRQWRYSQDGRRPSPMNCVDIERVTGGAVRRWELRPADWHRIWPELIGAEGAPPVPADQPQEVRDAA